MDVSWLFETEALVVSSPDSPFWYTSGLIGPYYINTHYLCGGAETAAELLSFIDEAAEDKDFYQQITTRLEDIYQKHKIFHETVDALVELASTKFSLDQVKYVSGGQRRDWFFSPILAEKLGKESLLIYNDKRVVGASGEPAQLGGSSVLHVADLLTVGSSYQTKWVSAIADSGGKLDYSLNAVDRNQGGVANLVEAGVGQVESMFVINEGLFEQASERGLVDQGQLELLRGYLQDPYGSMREFLLANSQFVAEALKSEDERKRGRAELMVSGSLYGSV